MNKPDSAKDNIDAQESIIINISDLSDKLGSRIVTGPLGRVKIGSKSDKIRIMKFRRRKQAHVSKKGNFEKTTIEKRPVKMALPPGQTYSVLGRLILTRKAYERILEPSITMMQEEYFEAYTQGRHKFALWIKIRFAFIFLMVLGLNLPVVKQLLDIKDKLA